MKPHYSDERVTVYSGDCIEVLRTLPDASVDSVVTDPPYGLEFMGKEWDRPWAVTAEAGVGYKGRGDLRLPSHQDSRNANCRACGGRARGAKRCKCTTPQWDRHPREDMLAFGQWCELWVAEALRVLKPGGHLLAFGGTRTWHRLAVAVEDAGFEVRDSIAWLYGSGFPKSLDVSRAIDAQQKHGGSSSVQKRKASMGDDYEPSETYGKFRQGAIDTMNSPRSVAPAQNGERTPDAARWSGWGTALKPAHEPIVVARKPLTGTVAGNVLEHGTGGLNIDGCRIGFASEEVETQRRSREAWAKSRREGKTGEPGAGSSLAVAVSGDTRTGHEPVVVPPGRWPANVVLDEDQAAALDRQSGVTTSGAAGRKGSSGFAQGYDGGYTVPYGDTGGASRFFYVAKAPARERPKVDGIAHPTVKPLTLMRWLCRLVTPPGGVILEPFAGSGTTIEAALHEGFNVIAIERETDYLPLIDARLARYSDETDGQLPLAT